MNSRINFYETYYKNVSPTTFEVKRSGDKIIIDGFDKKYPKNFKPKDVKQYPVNEEKFKNGGLISKRINKGEYEVHYKGKKFFLTDVKGEVEGTLTWHIAEENDGESWFSIRREDALWNTKREALEMIEYIVDKDENGEYDYLKDNPEYYKKGGETKSWKNKYNKKYGYPANESHSIKEISKDTGVSVKGLKAIYKKGVGARKTNPQSVRSVSDGKKRGGKSLKGKMGAQQWAMARIYSAVMGGKAAKVDAKELKMKDGGALKHIVNIHHDKPKTSTDKMYRVEVFFNTTHDRPRLDFYGFKNKYSRNKDKVHLGYSDSELYINDLKMLNLYNFKLFDEYNNKEIFTRLVDLIKNDMQHHTGKSKLMILNTTY